MSYFDKLKRLKDEVNRLIHEGLDEKAVLNQLRINEQFESVNLRQVQAFYSSLQKQFNAKVEDKRKIAECEQRIAERQQKIAEYEQQLTKENRQVTEQLIAVYELDLVKDQRMKIEMESMVKYEQNSNKFRIYDDYFDKWLVGKIFWQGRCLLTLKTNETTDAVRTIKIQDLLQGATTSFTFQNVGLICGIYSLKFPFVLFYEYNSSSRVDYLRLIKFDFESKSVRIVQTFEFNVVCRVLVSASDTSKFLLCRDNDVDECKLIGDQIQFGKKFGLESNFDIDDGSYFDEQLCGLKFEESRDNQYGNRQLTQVKMLLYDLEQDEHSTQDIDSTPENVGCLDPNKWYIFAWIRGTVFCTVQFPLTQKYGIIFTNSQLRNWKFVEFATDMGINHIQSFADRSLMICSENVQSERKIYKFQMHKPDSLRNMAWITMIKLLKEAKIENSYEEARQYLPLNSEIQPLFSPTISKTSNSLLTFFFDIYYSFFNW